jgi:hypothetical protein
LLIAASGLGPSTWTQNSVKDRGTIRRVEVLEVDEIPQQRPEIPGQPEQARDVGQGIEVRSGGEVARDERGEWFAQRGGEQGADALQPE